MSTTPQLPPAFLADCQRRQAASMDASNAALIAAGLPPGMVWGGPRPVVVDAEVERLRAELRESHNRAERIISGMDCGCGDCVPAQ